jgi:hypothetical protein
MCLELERQHVVSAAAIVALWNVCVHSYLLMHISM